MSDPKNPNDLQILKGEEKILLDHNYDGIQELDHVLPRWWLGILFGSIVFAAYYAGYYLSGHGPGSRQELATDMKVIEELRAKSAPPPSDNNEQTLLIAFKDPGKLKHGSEVFASKCIACHGENAQGVIGPNLTDDFWLHGKGTLKDIATVVASGVPEKGMPPWGQILAADELRDVVAFVHSKHGSNPAGAKPPQGEMQQFAD